MFTKQSNAGKKLPSLTQKNTVEAISDSRSSSIVDKAAQGMVDFGSNVFDQMFGNFEQSSSQGYPEQRQQRTPEKIKGNLFHYSEHRETQVVPKEIQTLTEQIRNEVKSLSREVTEAVKDAEKLSIETLSEKPGIYHIRLLEVILNLLKSLRAKVGESRTWMEAMITKKKKRGSLFAVRSKKLGTQYSLSEEQKVVRSTQ